MAEKQDSAFAPTPTKSPTKSMCARDEAPKGEPADEGEKVTHKDLFTKSLLVPRGIEGWGVLG